MLLGSKADGEDIWESAVGVVILGMLVLSSRWSCLKCVLLSSRWRHRKEQENFEPVISRPYKDY